MAHVEYFRISHLLLQAFKTPIADFIVAFSAVAKVNNVFGQQPVPTLWLLSYSD